MRVLIFIAIVTLISCSQPEKKQPEIQQVSLGVEELADYPKVLSEWGLFKTPMSDLIPKDVRTFPYEINSALFSDYASKARFISLPADQPIEYHDTEVLNFPKQTVLIKNFFYPADFQNPEAEKRIMETRLLIHEAKGWKAIVYQWNEEQTDAKRVVLGKKVPVEWKDVSGTLQRINYSIPSQPQCKSCHDQDGKMTPIGPSARQLNRDGQLTEWVNKGWLKAGSVTSFPKLVNYSDDNEALDARARAWLEVNCAHCHRREGPAKNSGLYLLASQTDPYRLGVNKPPIAAGKGSGGLKYSIVPGNSDQSILVHRITSLEPGEMMPELGRSLNHEEGIELIKEWVSSME
ncbi:SO2930 family diheme c-type cytochrome [Ekhidna sp. To15]|uniref:SO2930 family diheme c-type cytochrome n=1 Tax=Ekhidna sp. To15 TaxID=3395267 RepID=UPI003F523559